MTESSKASEMVERVARALWTIDRWEWPEPPPTADKYRERARAAIGAMRIPTEQMRRAGERTQVLDATGAWVGPVTESYTAMIDEALK